MLTKITTRSVTLHSQSPDNFVPPSRGNFFVVCYGGRSAPSDPADFPHEQYLEFPSWQLLLYLGMRVSKVGGWNPSDEAEPSGFEEIVIPSWLIIASTSSYWYAGLETHFPVEMIPQLPSYYVEGARVTRGLNRYWRDLHRCRELAETVDWPEIVDQLPRSFDDLS